MRRDLITKAPDELSNAELLEVLTERYEATVVPPCRVCALPLTIARMGGGEPTVWACDMWEDDPDKPGESRRKAGRGCADQHYSDSQFVDRRQGGDRMVMELIQRFSAPVDMALFCPECGLRHVDGVDERIPDWKNEPHRSHLCRPEHGGCGAIWRPADVTTNGVAEIKTNGALDHVLPSRAARARPVQDA